MGKKTICVDISDTNASIWIKYTYTYTCIYTIV